VIAGVAHAARPPPAASAGTSRRNFILQAGVALAACGLLIVSWIFALVVYPD